MVTRGMRVATLTAALLLTLVTASCSEDDGPATERPTVPVAADPTGDPPAQLGLDEALKLNGVTTTIEKIDRHFSNGEDSYAPRDKSLEWLGVKARSCVAEGAATARPTGWFQFAAVTAGGDWYPALTWRHRYPLPSTEWPLPRYPIYSQVPSGECAAGWLLIAVPKAAQVDKVVFITADSEAQAAWQLL